MLMISKAARPVRGQNENTLPASVRIGIKKRAVMGEPDVGYVSTSFVEKHK